MQVETYAVPRKRPLTVSGFVRRTRARGAYRQRRRYRRPYGRVATINTELKFHDIIVDDSPVPIAGAVQAALLTIPEGNGEEERIGRSITIKKIAWRYTITKSSQATLANTSDVVRVFLVHDKQANGALPAVLDLLETAVFQSFNNLSNSRRFRVLMDKTYDLSNPSGSGQNAADAFGEFTISDTFFKECNITIEYDNSAATGAITTIRSSNIFALYISQDARCVVVSNMRFRYTDR